MSAAERTCLRCGKSFDSAGPANRFCSRCGWINVNIPLSEAQLQRQRGVKRWNGVVMVEVVCSDLAGGRIRA